MPLPRLTSVADVTQDQAQTAGPKHQCVVGLHQHGIPPYTIVHNLFLHLALPRQRRGLVGSGRTGLVDRSSNNITYCATIAMILVQLWTEVIMAGKTKRAALMLTDDQRAMLKELAGSRTAPLREVERAKVLVGYAEGGSITQLQREIGVSRPMIYKCIDKALSAGVRTGLKDAYHRPREPQISDQAKAWVVSIACTKPKDHGLAAELWSISALARFVAEGAQRAGFPRLASAGKSTVWRILDEHEIKPHKIPYYLEKRDPEFDRKMQEVLLVYRDVSIYASGAVHDARPDPIYTVSVDEKPGGQAIGLTAR